MLQFDVILEEKLSNFPKFDLSLIFKFFIDYRMASSHFISVVCGWWVLFSAGMKHFCCIVIFLANRRILVQTFAHKHTSMQQHIQSCSGSSQISGGLPAQLDGQITLCARTDLDQDRLFRGSIANLMLWDVPLNSLQVSEVGALCLQRYCVLLSLPCQVKFMYFDV